MNVIDNVSLDFAPETLQTANDVESEVENILSEVKSEVLNTSDAGFDASEFTASLDTSKINLY
jgi:hypothetical protein